MADATIGLGIVSVGRSLTEEQAEARFKGQLILVQIELPAFGANPALILRLSTRTVDGKPFVDKDGYVWTARIETVPAIDYGGADLLEAHYQPHACDFVVLDGFIPGQADTETFDDLLWRYEFTGARCWIRQAFTDLNAASEYPTIFDGEITEWDDADPSRVPFHAVTEQKWNVIVPDRTMTAGLFPNASTASSGTPLPWFYGNGRDRRYLSHPTLPNTFEASDAGIARGAIPLLLIDAPTAAGGLSLPKLLISDRDIATTADNAWFVYESDLGRLAGPGVATVTNPAGGPATLTPNNIVSRVPIIPIEFDATTPTPFGGTQELLRETKPNTLAGVSQGDFDANQRLGRWKMPDVSPKGKFVSADLIVYYAKNAWNPTLGEAAVYNGSLLTSTIQAFGAGASLTYPSPNQFQDVTTIPIGTSVVSDWPDIKNCYLELKLRAALQKLQVHRVVLRVQYQVAAKTERMGVQRKEGNNWLNLDLSTRLGRRLLGQRDVTDPDVQSYDLTLSWYGNGRLDTSGAITGTAGTLLEHPVDIVRDILQDVPGITAGQIVTVSGEFGSFADAKTQLVGYKLVALLSRQQLAARLLEQMSDQVLCWFRRKGTTPGAPFVAIPWEVGQALNYRTAGDLFTFQRNTPWVRESSLERFRTKITRVVNRLRVNFDWDPRTNTYAQQIFVTDTDSRIWIGGFVDDYVPDIDGREAIAATSVARYGPRDHTMNLQWVVDPTTATDILLRAFDLLVTPRVGIRFDTFVQAYDLECGHRIALGDDWDSVMSFPRPGSDGSWGGKVFTVTGVKRPRDRPVVYQVEAVETTS